MSRSAAGNAVPRPTSTRRPAAESDRPVQPALLTPGSAVRVPVGYVWVLTIAVIAAVVGSFMIGRSRGFEAGRIEGGRLRIAEEQASQEAALLREPVAPVVSDGPARSVATGSESARTVREPVSSPPAGGAGIAADRPSDVLAERREPGKWYYQIITTRYDLAVEVASAVSQAGKDLGLDAQVVPGETGGLAIVYLLPGFDKASLTEGDQERWRKNIRELGSRVVGKVSFGSSTEHPFSDAFPKKYSP
jgi:hypothetical protein